MLNTDAERSLRRCRGLAKAYAVAGAYRGRCIADCDLSHKAPWAEAARFEAGMAETNAWAALLEATNELMTIAGLDAAIKIRVAASRANTLAVVRSMKVTLLGKGAA